MLEKPGRSRAGLGKITADLPAWGRRPRFTDAHALRQCRRGRHRACRRFLTMWGTKTRGNMNVRGLMAMNRQPGLSQHAQSERQVDPPISPRKDLIALPARRCRCRRSLLPNDRGENARQVRCARIIFTVGMSHPGRHRRRLLSGEARIPRTSPRRRVQTSSWRIRDPQGAVVLRRDRRAEHVQAAGRDDRALAARPTAAYKGGMAANFWRLNDFIARHPRETAEISSRSRNTKLPARSSEMISDRSSPIAPERERDEDLTRSMNKVGALENHAGDPPPPPHWGTCSSRGTWLTGN